MIKEKMLLEDLNAVLKEAKSMGCTEVRRFENIQLEKLEVIVNALEKQTWVSVKDRLPKDDEYVLIWCKGEFINGTNMGEECEWYGIGYNYGLKWEVFQCKDIEDIEVLAWMPLPKPYKLSEE